MNKNGVEFHEIYLQYAAMVRRVLARLLPISEVDDGVQEVFLKIHRYRHAIREGDSVKSWVYRICINTAQDYHRSHSWRKLWRSVEQAPDLPVKTQNAEERLSDHQALAQGLERLSFKERSVLVLFYWEELKLEEIAAHLDIPEGTVKSRLSIARNRLQTYLQEEGEKL